MKRIKVVWVTLFSNQKVREHLQFRKVDLFSWIRKLGKGTRYFDEAKWITNGIAEFEKFSKYKENNSFEFKTNSTRDYQFKYVSRYIVQIENEKNFPVTKMIIGNNGMLLRKILYDNCINFGDHTTKIRLRGRGSGYKEGPKNEESKDPMELCISSLNILSFTRCSIAIETLLLKIYYEYYLYQCKMYSEKKNENKNIPPITLKKILKYQYTVNRFNTLVKEEKRRKKEQEENNNKTNGKI